MLVGGLQVEVGCWSNEIQQRGGIFEVLALPRPLFDNAFVPQAAIRFNWSLLDGSQTALGEKARSFVPDVLNPPIPTGRTKARVWYQKPDSRFCVS
jgi:hypothetical protein